jgi:hypothetical protein
MPKIVKKFSQVNPIFEALFGTEHNLKSVDVITGEKTYHKEHKNAKR